MSDDNSGVHYLWHLFAIGLIVRTENLKLAVADADSEGPHLAGYVPHPDWLGDPPERLTRVAVIDNGCTSHHPNLDRSRVAKGVEFSSHPMGLWYANGKPESDRGDYRNLVQKLRDVGIDDLIQFSEDFDITPELRSALETALTGGDAAVPGTETLIPDPGDRFSAHGTACSGLVAASAEVKDGDPKNVNPSQIRYAGVDRHAQVIPIATVYNHEYWPLIMALLYSVAQDVDLILFPRAVEEMQDPDEIEIDDPGHSEFRSDRHRFADMKLFEKLLAALSNSVPIIVSAGNTGGTTLEYPAKLVNQGASNLIVVGAANSKGKRSSYSSISDLDGNGNQGVTTYAPSDDRSEISQSHFRYSKFDWRGRRIRMIGNRDNDLGEYSVLAIDLPGEYGYDGSGIPRDFDEYRAPDELSSIKDKAEFKPASLYTIFGGTSAACSIVAGVVSLMRSKSGKRLTGREVKAILIDAKHEMPVVIEESFLPVGNQSQTTEDRIRIVDAIEAVRMAKAG